MKKLLLTAVLLVFALSYTSCKKDDDDETTKITVTSLLNGNPVNGNELVLFKEPEAQIYDSKSSDANGKAVFTVEPGSYSFEFDYYDGDNYGGEITTFTVSSGENKKITINLEDWGN